MANNYKLLLSVNLFDIQKLRAKILTQTSALFVTFVFDANLNNMWATHFSEQPVYNQIIKLLDKQKIKKISLEIARSGIYVKR